MNRNSSVHFKRCILGFVLPLCLLLNVQGVAQHMKGELINVHFVIQLSWRR